jgi:ankyrin repeat and BTB/POZ domain-containing protein 1
MMDENNESSEAARAIAVQASQTDGVAVTRDEALDISGTQGTTSMPDVVSNPFVDGKIRTLDGDIAGDEFASDAINYQVLLRKIDALLERLKLDA